MYISLGHFYKKKEKKKKRKEKDGKKKRKNGKNKFVFEVLRFQREAARL